MCSRGKDAVNISSIEKEELRNLSREKEELRNLSREKEGINTSKWKLELPLGTWNEEIENIV